MPEASATFDRRAYVVEDDAALRRTIARTLTGAGVYVEEFSSAEALLDSSCSSRAACIITDLRLPGMSGLDLLRRVKKERHPSAVIVMSGYGDIPTAVEAVKQGAFDFLQKPFRKDDLLRVVGHSFELVRTDHCSSSASLETLTRRERQVLAEFSDGAPNKIVAHKIGLSVRTVEVHRANIIKKLGVGNFTQALLLSRDSGYGDETNALLNPGSH